MHARIREGGILLAVHVGVLCLINYCSSASLEKVYTKQSICLAMWTWKWTIHFLPSWTRLVFLELRIVSNQTNFIAAAAILNFITITMPLTKLGRRKKRVGTSLTTLAGCQTRGARERTRERKPLVPRVTTLQIFSDFLSYHRC